MTVAEWIGVAGFAFTVLVALLGFGIRGALLFSNALKELRKELTDAIVSTNNTLLAHLNLQEDALTSEFQKRTLELERDHSNFKNYAEREFVSKSTFNLVMDRHSAERREMKTELLLAMSELKTQLREK